MAERRYKWSFAELVDRLSIVNMKIVYCQDDKMREGFLREREDILHDLDLFINEGAVVDSRVILGMMLVQLINHEIWLNEAGGRGEGETKNYEYTHSLNFDRSTAKKYIQQLIGGRIDHKLNYSKGAWELGL